MVPQLGSLLLNVSWASAINSSAWSCAATAYALEHFFLAATLLICDQHLTALTLTTQYALHESEKLFNTTVAIQLGCSVCV